MNPKITCIFGVATIITCLPASAVISYTGLETNSAGQLLGGTWSGNGSIQPNLTPGTSSYDGGTDTLTPGNSGVLIQNFFGSGTLSFNGLDPGTGTADANNERLLTASTASITFSVSGPGTPTADLLVANSNPFDNGANNFNSLGLTGLDGANSISVTISFNNRIAGRLFEPTNLGAAPILAGTQLIDPGTGLTAAGFQVTAAYNGIFSSTDGINFTPGVSAIPTTSAIYGTSTAGQTTFTSNSYATGSEWHILRGYDVNGDGAYDADDANKVYIDSLTYTITADSGTFADDTQFVFSLDGEQFPNLSSIPEPASALLGAFASLFLIVRRKR